MSKIFCISDIHGCYNELMALYSKLDINPKKDKLILLGDYIDRGLQTKQVVDQLIKWKKQYPHWVFLYGNHEDLMLDALMYGGRIYGDFYLWFNQGGKQTFESYVPKNLTRYEKAIINVKNVIPGEHLEFLASLPRYYEDENYIYVHAGLEPDKKLEDTDPYQLIWIRESFIHSDFDWGKKVIFGHTTDDLGEYYNPKNSWGKKQKFMPIVKKNKIGIDTAVCPPSRKRLTALELPLEKFLFEEVSK